MKVGWSAYEPGLYGVQKTSTGGAQWTSYLFSEFGKDGHQVVWLGLGDPPPGTIKGKVSDCDVVIVCWRWEMPDYPERNEAYYRQRDVLDAAAIVGKKVIVHDQDYKISKRDMKTLVSMNAVIARPELVPDRGVKSLIFPNPFEGPIQLSLAETKDVDLVYVGNNYERYEQALKFIAPFSMQFSTAMYGNWVESSKNRESPEKVHEDFPCVKFPGRAAQEDVLKILSSAKSSIHLFKPEYGRTGFTTIRWAEAVAAGTPSFVPSTFRLPKDEEKKFKRLGLVVSDGEEMAKRFQHSNHEIRQEQLEAQKDFVKKYMTADRWFEVINEIVYK